MGCQQVCMEKENEKENTLSNQTKEKPVKASKCKSAESTSQLKNDCSALRSSLKTPECTIQTGNLKIKFIATNIHKLMPIWIEKGRDIKFSIKGEWGFEEYDELFDYLGCSTFDEKPNGLNFGSLAGYIPGESYFAVTDKLEYTSNSDGPLYLLQNNGLYSVTPKGELEVEIEGGIQMSFEEIERCLGWEINELDTSVQEMREDEIALLILINKVRSNPQLFCKQYLVSRERQVEIELEETLRNLQPLPCLSCSSKLYRVSKNHSIDLSENQIAGHLSSDGLNVEQRLQRQGILTKIFAENCIFGYNDPIEILMRLLLDEDNDSRCQRNIILSQDFKFVGISIEKHKGEFCWSCIQDYTLET